MSLNLAPITITGASFTLDLQGVNFESLSWIEFLVETPYTLPLSMGGVNINLPAWYDYPIEINRQVNGVWIPINGAQAPITISPMLLPTLSSNMSNTLLVTLYQKGQVPAITTPQPLFRQGWVPNTVNSSVGGTAEKLINDGNASGTQIGEATILGGTSSAWTLQNQGLMVLGNTTGEDGRLDVLGALSSIHCDNTITIGSPTSVSVTGTTGEIFANSILLQYCDLLGGISKFGLYTVGTTQATFNHNLNGVVPDVIIVQLNGTTSTSAIVKVDYTSFTTTTFKATGSAAGLTFAGIALKLT